MAISLIIDTTGGSDFQGNDLRNVNSLHVGGSALASGCALQVTGDVIVSGNLRIGDTTPPTKDLEVVGAASIGQVDVQTSFECVGQKIMRIPDYPNASIPAAPDNGRFLLDSTNNRLVYFIGGNRYYLAGTSF
jgi:hypothetical protein